METIKWLYIIIILFSTLIILTSCEKNREQGTNILVKKEESNIKTQKEIVTAYLKAEDEKFYKRLANTASVNLDIEAYFEYKPIIYYNKITKKYKVEYPIGVIHFDFGGNTKGFSTLTAAKENIEEWYKRQYETIQEIEEQKNIENAWEKVSK